MADGAGTVTEVNARIVYWGIEGAGKTTNLEVIHGKLRPDHRGDLRRVPTRIDPTVAYAMMPIELGDIGGVRTRIQVSTAPGEPEQAPTRKQLLDRVDGVVFVADTRRERIDENLASFEELRSMLADYGRPIEEVPLVIQYNKRDGGDPYALEELHRKFHMSGVAAFEAVVKDGTAVLQTLTTISKRVIRHLRDRADRAHAPAELEVTAEAAPAPPPGVTQILDRATAPAEAAPQPAPPPGVTQILDGIAAPAAAVAPAPPSSGIDPALLANLDDAPGPGIAETTAQTESLFEPGFQDATTFPPVDGGGEWSIASVGTAAQEGARGVRIPIVLRDDSGREQPMTLRVQLDPDGGEGRG